MTAHDVVARVRRICGIKQVGHAGTLDPMARGVLPIALGRACRLLRFLQDDKIYLASILFGQATDTDDIEGKVIASSSKIPHAESINAALKNFSGEIEQIPPMYSAVHLNGERLYQLARRGESPVDIPKRQVRVFSIEQLDFKQADAQAVLDLKIHCSTGTFIRSIARDLGELLGTHACLSALLREKAGPFELSESHSLEELAQAKESGKLEEFIEAPEKRIILPSLELNQDQCRRLSYGQRIDIDSKLLIQNKLSSNELTINEYVLTLFNGRAMAVCKRSEKEAEINADRASRESYIVELKPEVVLVDGSSN